MSPPTTSNHRDSARSASSPTIRSPRRKSLVERAVLGLSLANLAAVLLLLLLVCVISEEWWPSLALTYLPRVPFVIPSVLLLAASLLVRRRLVWVNLFAMLLVLGPVMGLRLPLASIDQGGSETALTVVSYNIQAGSSNLDEVIAQLTGAMPDLIVLQEATLPTKKVSDFFDDWHFYHSGEYLVASRWPVRLKDVCRAEGFGRATAILCEVDHPDGSFLVCNVHLTTARHGLAQLRPDSPISGRGVDELDGYQNLRDVEAFETRSFVAEIGLETPTLVMGDFNMPTSSSLFQKYWRGMASAYDAAGFGYGYTSPCNTGNLWPANVPWLRIDHILMSRHWSPQTSWIGTSAGSDHRYIAAKVRRR